MITTNDVKNQCTIEYFSVIMKMISSVLLVLLPVLPAWSQNCGPLTAADFEGPFYVAGANLGYETAPSAELADPQVAALLTGKVRKLNNKRIFGC